jgi:tetratricopeptide (TPR) repeat protein
LHKVVYATNTKISVPKIGRTENPKNLFAMDRIEKLKEFLIANPDDDFVQHALALELIKLGKDDEARTLFEKILTLNPSYIGSYYHYAKLLERAGEKEQAIQWYESGMAAAKKAGENHAYNELQAAWEELSE